MTETSNDRALLPAGLKDELSPAAAYIAAVCHQAMASFAAWGYERVDPPLLEFEQSLLAGPGSALTAQTFRLMDPISQKMMGLRADITPQIARIAATRLAKSPRPLRLCYAGPVLRVKGEDLAPERQKIQAGVELIGSDAVASDVEVLLLAIETLINLGVRDLSVDFTLPRLVLMICQHLSLPDKQVKAAKRALDRKETEPLKNLSNGAADLFAELVMIAGPARPALEKLATLNVGPDALAELQVASALVDQLGRAFPSVPITLDPGEQRGFEYYKGIGFSLFAKNVRGELGKGGRYRVNDDEPATGFSLYLDPILQALPKPKNAHKLLVEKSTALEEQGVWRKQGWIVVACLEGVSDLSLEAQRLGCSHVLVDGQIKQVSA